MRLRMIFAVALALRLGYAGMAPAEVTFPGDDADRYMTTAQGLLQGRGYANGDARAYQPPLFAFAEAALFRVTGVRPAAVEVALAVVGALHCVFLALWAGRMASSPLAGNVAGALAAVYPPLVRYPHTRLTETLFLCLLTAGLFAAVRAQERSSMAGFLGAGALVGLSALTRESGILLLPAIGVWLYLVGGSVRDNGARLAALVIGASLVILPWTVRNWVVLGTAVPIATNGGINFYLGNSPHTPNGVTAAEYRFFVAPGIEWRDGAGEVEANRAGWRHGLAFVRQEPALALRRWAMNGVELWRPPSLSAHTPSERAVRRIWWMAYVGLLLLATLGALRLRHDWRETSLALLCVVTLSMPYLLTLPFPRYRLPAESLLLFYAAVALVRR